MTKHKRQQLRDTAFDLAPRVRAKHKEAEDQLILLHKQKFGDNALNRARRGEPYYRIDLDVMLQHLLA